MGCFFFFFTARLFKGEIYTHCLHIPYFGSLLTQIEVVQAKITSYLLDVKSNAVFLSIFFFQIVFIFVFIFYCAGSSLLYGLLSSCSKWRRLSSCGVQASHCSGLFCCSAQTLGHLGFTSCGSQTLEHRLNSCGAWA